MEPTNLEAKTLLWTTSDKEIVEVTGRGVLKAKKRGKVRITVSVKDKPSIKTECIVTVKKAIKATGIKLDKSEITLKEGEQAKLTATLEPADATSNITWKSSNTKVARVEKGTVTAAKKGTATITAKANGHKATCKIIVESEKNELDFSYKGNGTVKARFSSETLKIVEQHLYDLNAQNFYSYIKAKGGFAKYAKSLGGVFADYYGKTVKGKTEYDFQMTAEYVLGWMYMYGWDYCSGALGKATGRHVKWGGSNYTKDAFYYKGGWKSKYNGNFDDVISGKNGVGMMASECGDLEIFIYWKMGIPRKKQLPKVTKLKDLKVGDGIYFFDRRVDKSNESNWGIGRHNVIVGEVYSDRIVCYDGGSYYQNNRNYKRTIWLPKVYSEEADYAAVKKAFGYEGWGMRRWYNFQKN